MDANQSFLCFLRVSGREVENVIIMWKFVCDLWRSLLLSGLACQALLGGVASKSSWFTVEANRYQQFSAASCKL